MRGVCWLRSAGRSLETADRPHHFITPSHHHIITSPYRGPYLLPVGAGGCISYSFGGSAPIRYRTK